MHWWTHYYQICWQITHDEPEESGLGLELPTTATALFPFHSSLWLEGWEKPGDLLVKTESDDQKEAKQELGEDSHETLDGSSEIGLSIERWPLRIGNMNRQLWD